MEPNVIITAHVNLTYLMIATFFMHAEGLAMNEKIFKQVYNVIQNFIIITFNWCKNSPRQVYSDFSTR